VDSDVLQNWFCILNNCYKFSSKGLELALLCESNLLIIILPLQAIIKTWNWAQNIMQLRLVYVKWHAK